MDTRHDPAWLAAPNSGPAASFARHHREHPDLYRAIERRALMLFGLGMTRISISLLVESLRFDVAKANGGKTFQINNTHRAYYARLLIHRNPALRGVIETRRVARPWA